MDRMAAVGHGGVMTTMDCSTLETLLENHEPVALIDTRSKRDFAAMHIPGARSLPFAELAAPRIFLRRRPTAERVYVISDDIARASLATGILRASGWVNAMAVDGGMKAWLAQGFPVLRRGILFELTSVLKWVAVLLGIGATLAVLFHQDLIATLMAANAGILLLKARSITRERRHNQPAVAPQA